MTGIGQSGAQVQLNALTNVSIPVVQGTAPTGVNGGWWINSSSSYTVNMWNGSAWIAAANNYLALLTADPTGQTTIAGLSECGDSGYARVQVAFTAATAASPSIAANSSLLTFGPFSVNMSLPVQWLALVTPASGTTGLLLDTWTISSPQQVSATQTINIAASALQITTS
jgi:hypothetical protein